jgi:hypothetical protein
MESATKEASLTLFSMKLVTPETMEKGGSPSILVPSIAHHLPKEVYLQQQ